MIKKIYAELLSQFPEDSDTIGEFTFNKCSTHPVLGISCFGIPNDNKLGMMERVALLLLATRSGLIVIFQLSKFQQLPVLLKNLLEEPRIIKVSVGPLNDMVNLAANYSITVAGVLDLNDIAEQVGVRKRGLHQLARNELQIELEKIPGNLLMDCELKTIPNILKHLAANDVHAKIKLFMSLTAKLGPLIRKIATCELQPQRVHPYRIVIFESVSTKLFKNERIKVASTYDECARLVEEIKR